MKTRRNRKVIVRYPHAQEVAYVKALRPFADDVYRATLEVVFPALSLGKSKPFADALTADLGMYKRAVQKTVFKMWPDKLLRQVAALQAGRVSEAHRYQLEKSLAVHLTVRPYIYGKEAPAVRRVQAAFIERNVDLIKSIPDDYLERVGTRINRAFTSGQRVETLAKELQSTYNLTRGKASFIARDQTGKLFGELNRERQTSIGIAKYEWDTMGDERVRPMHADLDGEIIFWGEPPVTNEDGEANDPGEDYQCRCTANGLLD